MDYQGLKNEIITLLKEKLSDKLYYHDMRHTLDVLDMTIEICASENIDEYHTFLLKTAAILHDSGFTRSRIEHEAHGCDIAQELLPKYGYSQGEIDMIKGMIMATKIPQSPKNIYEEIICDADLDYLGRDDFWKIGSSLFKELEAYEVLNDEQKWNAIQVGFLQNHTYFTKTNKERRQGNKLKFLEELKVIVSNYK